MTPPHRMQLCNEALSNNSAIVSQPPIMDDEAMMMMMMMTAAVLNECHSDNGMAIRKGEEEMH